MVEGLLRQKNTVQRAVFQGPGVAEGRMCGTRERNIVQSDRQLLIEAHAHLEGEVD